MTDVAHEKYSKLMTEIEDLEDKIDDMEKKADADDAGVLALKQDMADKKNELARLSDGCGTGHSM